MHTGIDLGLRVTALVTLDDGGKLLHKTQFGYEWQKQLKRYVKAHPCTRYGAYYDHFTGYFTNNSITGTVVMEEPAGIMLGHGRKLGELKGVYLTALYHLKLPVNKMFLPSPTAIKKFFAHNGAATKTDMIKACENRGILPRNDHEADAIAMAFMSIEGVL